MTEFALFALKALGLAVVVWLIQAVGYTRAQVKYETEATEWRRLFYQGFERKEDGTAYQHRHAPYLSLVNARRQQKEEEKNGKG